MDLGSERFELGPLIGEGSSARIFRATDRSDGSSVAIKVFRRRLVGDVELLARFQLEADLLGRLEHPNILPLLGRGTVDDSAVPWFATLFAPGGSLADHMVRNGLLRSPEMLEHASEILDALHYLHGLDIVHRDVKPENILLDKDDIAVLCDFGIAKYPQRPSTMIGDLMGTPSFMAPEQYSDAGSVTNRSDLFCLGVTMFVGITGQSGISLLIQHMRNEALDALSVPVRAIVDRATLARPEERYESAWAMALDVADAMESH